MKVISNNLKTASIALSVELFNLLKQDAGYISQIPNQYLSVQSKPLPYYIFEENPLHTLIKEMKEKEMSKKAPIDMMRVIECNKILDLLEKDKPVFIFCTMTA